MTKEKKQEKEPRIILTLVTFFPDAVDGIFSMFIEAKGERTQDKYNPQLFTVVYKFYDDNMYSSLSLTLYHMKMCMLAANYDIKLEKKE